MHIDQAGRGNRLADIMTRVSILPSHPSVGEVWGARRASEVRWPLANMLGLAATSRYS